MRAVRLHGKGDIRLEDVPAPSALGPRDVLLKTRFCGICGTDLHEYVEGAKVVPSKPHPLTGAMLPQILGHELSGDVVEVGSEVTVTKPGDRVALMPELSCGRCYFCQRGLNQLCASHACVGLSWAWGGFAEYLAVPDYTIVVLPDAISYEQGALLEPTAVAAYAVERGKVQGGDSVLVAGAGPIGMLAALYAGAIGAGKVYITETNPNRVRLAESLGIGRVFNPAEPDAGYALKNRRDPATGVFDPAKSWVVDALRELTDGVGVDVAIDCTGSEGGLNSCINATRARGTVVEAALQVKPPAIDAYALALKDLDLVSTWCFMVYDFPRYASVIAANRLPVEKIITSVIPLEDVEEKGFKVLTDPAGTATKILVSPDIR
jgi:(R,R)-butanediol dehydrogenase / meso-butanediol dehydrogenase / diacetyl reductase